MSDSKILVRLGIYESGTEDNLDIYFDCDNLWWQVDESGNLSILKEGKVEFGKVGPSSSVTIATFACGEWRYIRQLVYK